MRAAELEGDLAVPQIGFVPSTHSPSPAPRHGAAFWARRAAPPVLPCVFPRGAAVPAEPHPPLQPLGLWRL